MPTNNDVLPNLDGTCHLHRCFRTIAADTSMGRVNVWCSLGRLPGMFSQARGQYIHVLMQKVDFDNFVCGRSRARRPPTIPHFVCLHVLGSRDSAIFRSCQSRGGCRWRSWVATTVCPSMGMACATVHRRLSSPRISLECHKTRQAGACEEESYTTAG